MKYLNLSGFYKHLESSSPNHLCRLYLIQVQDDYERGKILKKTLSHFSIQPTILKEVTFSSIQNGFESLSFFDGEPLLYVDEIDKMSANEAKALQKWMQNPFSFGYFLAGAKGKTILSSSFEKQGVVLDLGEEKPWDKDRRIVEELQKRAAMSGKQIAPTALALMLEKVGKESAFLDSELDKLISYIGERGKIEEKDVAEIVCASKNEILWVVAEEMIFEKKNSHADSFSFSALIAPLRSQLTLGRTILSLTASGVPFDEWNKHLPKIWPKTLEKRTAQATKLGPFYFEKGLDVLYQLELLSRSGQSNEEALLCLFYSCLS